MSAIFDLTGNWFSKFRSSGTDNASSCLFSTQSCNARLNFWWFGKFTLRDPVTLTFHLLTLNYGSRSSVTCWNKICTKFRRNWTIRSWVIDVNLAHFRRTIFIVAAISGSFSGMRGANLTKLGLHWCSANLFQISNRGWLKGKLCRKLRLKCRTFWCQKKLGEGWTRYVSKTHIASTTIEPAVFIWWPLRGRWEQSDGGKSEKIQQ